MIPSKNSNKIYIRVLTKTTMDMETIKKSYEQISSKSRNIWLVEEGCYI